MPGGKLNRGLTVVHAFQSIKGDAPITREELHDAALLGWCVEWLQAFFLVADDMMDESETRRGQPCWYKQPDVKLVAINDSFLLKSHIYLLLRKHFKSSRPAMYMHILDLFLDTTVQTELGQLLDLTSNPMDGPTDLDRFTIERYMYIVKYKTAFYSFYLPVALALVLGGKASEANLGTAKDILVEMGTYFQVQDDYLDCYGAPEVIGKIGTDIKDNKCSWLVVQALNKATAEQKALLKVSTVSLLCLMEALQCFSVTERCCVCLVFSHALLTGDLGWCTGFSRCALDDCRIETVAGVGRRHCTCLCASMKLASTISHSSAFAGALREARRCVRGQDQGALR